MFLSKLYCFLNGLFVEKLIFYIKYLDIKSKLRSQYNLMVKLIKKIIRI